MVMYKLQTDVGELVPIINNTRRINTGPRFPFSALRLRSFSSVYNRQRAEIVGCREYKMAFM